MRVVWDDVCPVARNASGPKPEELCSLAIVKAMSLGLTRVPFPPLTVMKEGTLTCCCLRIKSKTCRICWCILIGNLWEECRKKLIEFSEAAGVDVRPCFIEMDKERVSNLSESKSVTDVYLVGRRMEKIRLFLGEPCDQQLEIVINALFCSPTFIPVNLATCLSETLARNRLKAKSTQRENWVKDIKFLRPQFFSPSMVLPNHREVPTEYIFQQCESIWRKEETIFLAACKFPEIDTWLKSSVFPFILFFNNPNNSHTLCTSVFERFFFRMGFENLSVRLGGLLNEWAPKNFRFATIEPAIPVTFDVTKLLSGFELVCSCRDLEGRVFAAFQSLYMAVFVMMASVEFGYYCACDCWKIVRHWQDCRELYGLWWRVLNRVRSTREEVFSHTIQVAVADSFGKHQFDLALGEHGRVLRGLLDRFRDVVAAMHIVVDLRFALSRFMKFGHHQEEVLRIVRGKVDELEKINLVV
jgi:hypothetical protein